MAVMVAAGPDRGFEFFAQSCQKSFGAETSATTQSDKAFTHKKARPDCSGAGCEVQGNLEVLEILTVVGRFAV
jgi:hypothetical protein